MAQTWGDTIARGYGAGRAIGNDIAGIRFQRRAEKVRSEYEERAAAEGKTLEDYLPEMENRLRQSAIDVGATRRGINPEAAYAEGLRAEVARAGDRRAGALALEGKQAEARDSRARTQYSVGDFDQGQGQQIAGDTIRATSGAMRPDGTYDMAGGAQALAGVSARYGDSAQANAQQQSATTFSQQAAAAKAGSLLNVFQNLDKFSGDQVAGLWAGITESAPLLAGVDLRKDDRTNSLVYFINGKAAGSFDPKVPEDVDQLAGMLKKFTDDPGNTLNEYAQMRAQSIAEAKERDSNTATRYSEARIAAVQELTKIGAPPDVTDALVRAQRSLSSSEGGGWQLQDLGEEPGTYLMQKGGNVYVVKTNQGADPTTGFDGGPVQVFEADGVTPVDPKVLNRSEVQTLTTALADLSAAQARTGFQLKGEAVRTALNVFNQLEAQERGLTVPGSSTGGRRFPIKETDDYVRKITSNVGNPTGSSREVARQVMDALIQQESGGDHSAVSPKGARGITQVMPKTGTDPGFGVAPLRDQSEAEYRRFGEDYLTAMLDRYGGDLELALAAYNAGPGRADQWAKESGGAPQRSAIQTSVDSASQFAGVQGGASIKPQRALAARPRSEAPAREQLSAAQAELDRFDADHGYSRGPGAMGALGALRGGALGAGEPVRANTLTPAQRKAREMIADRVATLRRTAADEQRTTARTERTRALETENREAQELAAQYGGAADFFSRAAQAP